MSLVHTLQDGGRDSHEGWHTFKLNGYMWIVKVPDGYWRGIGLSVLFCWDWESFNVCTPVNMCTPVIMLPVWHWSEAPVLAFFVVQMCSKQTQCLWVFRSDGQSAVLNIMLPVWYWSKAPVVAFLLLYKCAQSEHNACECSGVLVSQQYWFCLNSTGFVFQGDVQCCYQVESCWECCWILCAWCEWCKWLEHKNQHDCLVIVGVCCMVFEEQLFWVLNEYTCEVVFWR